MIKRDYYTRVETLSNLRQITHEEVLEMETIIRTFNPKYSVCKKCGAQIRHGQKVLKNWLNTQEIIEDVLNLVEPNAEPQLVVEYNLDINVDEVEADKVGCTKCKSKANTTKKLKSTIKK